MCRSQYFQAILLVQSIAAPGQVMITSWLWLVRNLVRYLDIFGRRFQFQMSFLHCFYHHWCWQTAKCLEEKRSNHWLYTHLHWLHPHFFGLESPFLAFSRIFVGQNLESSWWFVSLLDIPMNFHEFPLTPYLLIVKPPYRHVTSDTDEVDDFPQRSPPGLHTEAWDISTATLASGAQLTCQAWVRLVEVDYLLAGDIPIPNSWS